MSKFNRYDVAAYVWPAYTAAEDRTRIFWPEGMGEWQSVRSAGHKFHGDNWPRRPLWGYVDEADPYVMEMEIDAASDFGVNVFIYDWYWYDTRPFLENCLNDGFLKARNNSKMKFYVMWANHDVNYTWDKRISTIQSCNVWEGRCDAAQFKKIALRLIEQYFLHPLYYKIDNRPVFAVYDIANLINGLGGMEGTRKMLDWFVNLAIQKGLNGIHFQYIDIPCCDIALMTDEKNYSKADACETVKRLGMNSVTHYQYVHFAEINRSYEDLLPDVVSAWNNTKNKYEREYFPNVSVGWNNNPRFTDFRKGIITGSSPDIFRKALTEAKEFVDKNCSVPLVTVNSWNEWTESSYLQPDDIFGYGYLQAVKEVFKNEKL